MSIFVLLFSMGKKHFEFSDYGDIEVYLISVSVKLIISTAITKSATGISPEF